MAHFLTPSEYSKDNARSSYDEDDTSFLSTNEYAYKPITIGEHPSKYDEDSERRFRSDVKTNIEGKQEEQSPLFSRVSVLSEESAMNRGMNGMIAV